MGGHRALLTHPHQREGQNHQPLSQASLVGWAAPYLEEGLGDGVGHLGGTQQSPPPCSGCLGGELWRWLSAYTCGLVCVASILTGTAGVLWMQEEGRRWFGVAWGGGQCGPDPCVGCSMEKQPLLCRACRVKASM